MRKTFLDQLKRPSIFWMFLGLTAILLRILLGFFPTVTEYVYSRGIFSGIRWLFDLTVTNAPFPLFYLLAGALLFYLGLSIYRFIKAFRQSTWKQSLVNFFLGLGGFLGAVIFFFLFLWGYNYSRIPVETQLALSLSAPDSLALDTEFQLLLQEAYSLRQSIDQNEEIALGEQHLPSDLESTMRSLLVEVLQEYGYTTPGKMRGRTLLPKGILLHFGTAGIYIPFIGEGHIDGGLHPLSQPFTLAHELTHGYGFGAEGTCNFWAYLACSQSQKPIIQYAGQLSYLRYLLGAMRRYGKEHYEATKQKIPQAILTDLTSIKQNNAKYPDWISAAPLNDAFLKAQGVKDGIESYSRVLVLVMAHRKKYSKN